MEESEEELKSLLMRVEKKMQKKKMAYNSAFKKLRSWHPVSSLHHISSSNENSGLIFFRNDRFDLLAVQGTLKSLLQNSSLKPLTLYFV